MLPTRVFIFEPEWISFIQNFRFGLVFDLTFQDKHLKGIVEVVKTGMYMDVYFPKEEIYATVMVAGLFQQIFLKIK